MKTVFDIFRVCSLFGSYVVLVLYRFLFSYFPLSLISHFSFLYIIVTSLPTFSTIRPIFPFFFHSHFSLHLHNPQFLLLHLPLSSSSTLCLPPPPHPEKETRQAYFVNGGLPRSSGMGRHFSPIPLCDSVNFSPNSSVAMLHLARLGGQNSITFVLASTASFLCVCQGAVKRMEDTQARATHTHTHQSTLITRTHIYTRVYVCMYINWFYIHYSFLLFLFSLMLSSSHCFLRYLYPLSFSMMSSSRINCSMNVQSRRVIS